METHGEVIIFTDGAARGNPGPGGWGSVVALPTTVYELGGGNPHTTNNRMELTAVIGALSAVPTVREMTVYTDSAYVLSGATRWIFGWKKNNWKTSTKDDVLNRDLWEELYELIQHKVINWQLLKGHSGIAGNERCDVIATGFADGTPPVLYRGSRDRYGVSLKTESAASSTQKKSSRAKAYSYVSLVDGEVKVHKTWEECKARVSGVSGARFEKATSPFEEEELIKKFTQA